MQVSDPVLVPFPGLLYPSLSKNSFVRVTSKCLLQKSHGRCTPNHLPCTVFIEATVGVDGPKFYVLELPELVEGPKIEVRAHIWEVVPEQK